MFIGRLKRVYTTVYTTVVYKTIYFFYTTMYRKFLVKIK